MILNIGNQNLKVFENMSITNNISIMGLDKLEIVQEILNIAKQTNPCRIVVISNHINNYFKNIPNIENFNNDYNNCIIICDDIIDINDCLYKQLDNISKNSRFHNSLLITFWNNEISNTIIKNSKYVVNMIS